MAGKQGTSEGFSSHLAGMSKHQLYDIMSQMKTLIEQNQQQARKILVENPILTRALFQAQIMLGMVQPPQVMPNIQQALSQNPQQSTQSGQPLNVQAAHPLSVQTGLQGQAISSQPQIPARQQHQNQPSITIPPTSVPPITLQSQTISSNSLQTGQQGKGHLNAQGTSISFPQFSQIHNPSLLPNQSNPPSIHHSHVPTLSSQAQQSLQPSGTLLQPLQPPLPLQPRPPSFQPFSHQFHSQMVPNTGFQHSQPLFHSGTNSQSNIGSSFSQGQPPPLPSQPPPQQLYQASSQIGDFSNQSGGSISSMNQGGSSLTSMQVERGPWMPGPPENTTGGAQLPGLPPPPPLVSGQMGSRPPQLTPEMEKALLQQVMSLTPEQINLLPPEQRHQVLQLQQMLR
ncbi:hydroxyproline-rich glycoprotein family protein [Tasmannia lanceolata]|uniref:hydroxyproline-rich glycoprotein family protein n=1 Tax=Tasmannia lanceolata TaxID=3420 RepID=UPI004062B6EE